MRQERWRSHVFFPAPGRRSAVASAKAGRTGQVPISGGFGVFFIRRIGKVSEMRAKCVILLASVVMVVTGARGASRVSFQGLGDLPGEMVSSSALDHTVVNMSVSRERLAGASVGRIAVFAGGYRTGGYYSDVVDLYDTLTGTWSNASLSQARHGPVGASVNDLALFAGGWNHNQNGSQSRVDMYRAGTGAWTTAELSLARTSVACSTVGSKVLFSGGVSGTPYTVSHVSDVVDIYDDATGTWSVAQLSRRRAGLAATTVNGEAIFAGGWDKLGGPGPLLPRDRVDIYHEATESWTTSSLSEPRYDLAATTVGSLALFGGGWADGGYSSVVDIYDSSTGQWSTASLSLPRAKLAAASVGPYAIFAGGETRSTIFSDVVDIYDSRDGSWSTSSLAEARTSLCGLSGQGVALFAGGRSVYPLTYSNVVDVYVPEPATLSMLALGTLAVLRRRRKKDVKRVRTVLSSGVSGS